MNKREAALRLVQDTAHWWKPGEHVEVGLFHTEDEVAEVDPDNTIAPRGGIPIYDQGDEANEDDLCRVIDLCRAILQR